MQLGTNETKLQRYTQAQIFMSRIASAKEKVKHGDRLTVWTLKGGSKEDQKKLATTERKSTEKQK